MTLGFTTIINNKPNYFIEKIWQSIFETVDIDSISDDYATYQLKYKTEFGKEWDIPGDREIRPKHHTVRRDTEARWRAGNDIHFVVNNRTSERFQFAPVLKCKTVQTIEIFTDHTGTETIHKISIDGRALDAKEIKMFAWRDGFDNTDALFSYFEHNFKGKLIHWTDLKY